MLPPDQARTGDGPDVLRTHQGWNSRRAGHIQLHGNRCVESAECLFVG